MNSPKGHPEIAGAGIEFDWGVSKKIFRKENNHKPKDCEKDLRLSLDKITLGIAKSTARKAHSYMMAYISDSGDSYFLIEKFVKIHKYHRNILDQETKYLDKVYIKIEQHVKQVEEENIIVSRDKKEREDAKQIEREKMRIKENEKQLESGEPRILRDTSEEIRTEGVKTTPLTSKKRKKLSVRRTKDEIAAGMTIEQKRQK